MSRRRASARISTGSSCPTRPIPTSGSPKSARFSRCARGSGRASQLWYRHRPKNTSRKAGNIGDFVSRWGGAYPQMVVLDADSLMTGHAIVTLAAAMEADPDAGIIQTLPLIINRNTLVRARAAIRGAHLRAGHRLRPVRLDGPRRQLLGPQRHHPHGRLRGALRPARPARQAAVRRPYPVATISSRPPSSGAPAMPSTCCPTSRAATRKARPR